MRVTVELSDENATALGEQARTQGLTLAEWLRRVAEEQAQPVSIVHLQESNPREWAKQFRSWADSHDPNIPVLTDEAMSRETIYGDSN